MKLDKLKKRFETVYSAESDAVFRYCFFRTSQREVALDLTQEVFMRFWDSLQNKKDIKSDRAFLFTISRNLVIDYYRKKKSASLDSIVEEVEDGSMIISDTESQNTILKSEGRFVLEKINQLDPMHRQVIYFRFVEDLKPKEIAEILGVTPNVVSVRIVRAIERLREITGYDIKDE